MKTRHWTSDDFSGNLYGVGPVDGHLEECGECRNRWETLVASRREFLAGLSKVEPSEELLAAQRRAVYHRMDQRRPHWFGFRLASAMAMLALLVVGFLLYRPAPAPRHVAVSDTQLMNDVFAMVESPLPQPLAPVEGLFEED